MSSRDSLVRAVMDLSRAREMGHVMKTVREAARGLTAADGATFVVREGDVCYYADEDAIGPLWKGRRFKAESCISGWTMAHRQAAVVEDVRADERIPLSVYAPTFVRSLLMVPIRTDDPVGAIGVYWARCRRATEEEVEIVQALADSTAVALENVRALAEARRWRALLAEASDTFWTYDPVGQPGEVRGVRRFWSEITGRPESIYADPDAWFEDVHPEDRPRVEAAWNASVHTRAPFRTRFRIRARNGTVRHLFSRAVPIPREDGTHEMVGMISDVTREQEAESEIRALLDREREARDAAEAATITLNQLLDRVSDAFVAFDRDWRYTYVNKRATEILGREGEDLVGKQVWTLFPEAGGGPFQAAMERALSTQQAVFEQDFFAPWGKHFENRIYPSETGLSVFFTDVTEARRLHAEVEAERRRLQRLAECVGAAIVMVSAPSGALAFANRRASELFGDELLDREESLCGPEVAPGVPGVPASPLDVLSAVLRTGAPVPDTEISHVAADGRRRILLASAVPVEAEGGEIEGVVASFHDVTEGHEVREALRQLSRRLLAAQDEERRRISLDLHDDLGQVLTAVKMSLVGLRSDAAANDVAVRNAVEIVDRSIRQVRDLSLRLHPPMLELLGLGPTLRWYVEERLRDVPVRAQVSVDPTLGRVGSVIENACFRVVQEAVTNALRHAAAREIRIDLDRELRAVRLAVRDDGRGFEPSGARSWAVGGGGLGLAGIQERVALAGGSLEVRSGAGGTEIVARFAVEGEP